MSETASDGSLTAMLHEQMPLTATLGVIAISGSADEVVLGGEWHESRCTSAGAIHGGYLMALADSAGAVCAVFNVPPGSVTTTIESKTNFMRAVTGGPVTATASPIHVGRRTIVVQTDITRDDGKLVSRTLQTQAVVALDPAD